MHTFLSYSDLKCNLNHAIHMKTSKKMMIFSDFLLTLFFIFWGWNSKKAKYREILHFEKHSSLCNRFGKRTMFFVFSFFHFLCKFRISTSPCQWPKIKSVQIFKVIFLVTLAKLGPFAESMQIFLLNIISEPSQSSLFTYFCIFIYTFFLFWSSLKHKCCLRREAVL